MDTERRLVLNATQVGFLSKQKIPKAIRLEKHIKKRNLRNMELWSPECEVFVWRIVVTLLAVTLLKKTLLWKSSTESTEQTSEEESQRAEHNWKRVTLRMTARKNIAMRLAPQSEPRRKLTTWANHALLAQKPERSQSTEESKVTPERAHRGRAEGREGAGGAEKKNSEDGKDGEAQRGRAEGREGAGGAEGKNGRRKR